MIPTDPIYTLRHAFEAQPIVSVFGYDGLRETLPQLEHERAAAEMTRRNTTDEFWARCTVRCVGGA
jgi:hypothetical protein